mgnify:CR=1 FL=1|jgi:Alpha-tubulin suppressor and related RCC1 domain-containing proteins
MIMKRTQIIAVSMAAIMLSTSVNAGQNSGDFLFRGKPGLITLDSSAPPSPGNPSNPGGGDNGGGDDGEETAFKLSASSTTLLIDVGDTETVTFSTEGAKGSVSYSLVSVIPELGATIDADTGVLSITPTASGTFSAQVRADDLTSGKSDNLVIDITVSEVSGVGPQPEIADLSAIFRAGSIGDEVTFTPMVIDKDSKSPWNHEGTTFSLNVDIAPYGLSFDTETGSITGAISTYGYLENVVISVTSSGGRTDSSAPFTMVLEPDEDMAFNVGVTDIVKTNPNTPTTKSLIVDNALGPVTYSIVSKSLGLNVSINSIASTYTLTAAGGNYTMTIRAVDAVGRTAEKEIAANIGTFYDLDYIALAKYNACGLSVEGALYCWGSTNPAAKQRVPTLVENFDSGVSTIAVGGVNVCAIKNGALYCVGPNSWGQLGDGTTETRTVMTPVVGMESGVTDVAVIGEITGHFADTYHACAVKNGEAYCWGSNSVKQVANTSVATYYVPQKVAGLPGTVTKVAVGTTAGTSFSCAIADNQVYCWGSNSNGQLGQGDLIDRATPTLISALGSNVTDLDASMHFACAVADNVPYCWGNNQYGQLGTGNKTRQTSPVAVAGMPNANRLDVGQYAVCAEYDNRWSCWGENVLEPKPVEIPYVLRYVSVGYGNTCALSDDGGYCWGSNTNYVFGDGTNVSSTTPRSVPYY